MHETSPVAVVRAWHDALNRADGAAVVALSDPDIEIVGPRGSGFGLDLLRRWLDHARVSLHPRRTFLDGDTVVVQEEAVWRSPETGAEVGRAEVASIFRVRDGRVSYYRRCDEVPACAGDPGAEGRQP